MAASTSCLRRPGPEIRQTTSSQSSSGLIRPYHCGHALQQQQAHSRSPLLDAVHSQTSASSLPSSSASIVEQSPLEAPSSSKATTAGPSRPLHTCPHCAKSFSRPAKLQDHLLIHSDSRPYACSYEGCEAAFRTKSKLLAHEKKAHLDILQQEQEKKFLCTYVSEGGQVCARRFWTNQHLLRHVEGVHDAGATDAEREEAEEGDDGRRSGSYLCTEPGCTQAFSKRKRLRRHVWEAHTDHGHEGDAADADADADADGDTAQEREGREGTLAAIRNKLPFPCSFPDCAKRFPTNSKRKSHFKTHAQDRYTCALPHSSSSDTPSLSPPVGAPELLAFPTWSALQAHMREVHPPACHYPACNGKVFKNRENLKMHLRRHEEREHEERRKEREGEGDAGGKESGQNWCEASSDEEEEAGEGGAAVARGSKSLRVFHCTWRPDAMPTDGSGNGITNENITPAPAPPCSKSFKSSHALQTHIRVAHLKERSFQCLCGKAYGHKHLLKRHEVKCAVLLAQLQQEQQKRVGDDTAKGAEADAEDEDEAAAPPSELDEDEEDEVFRQGGGALPEKYRESASALGKRPAARASFTSRRAKRKRGEAVSAAAAVAGEDGQGGGCLVNLLTGRGYASPSAALSPIPHSQTQTQARRKRPRALPCPWTRLRTTTTTTTPSDPPSTSTSTPSAAPSPAPDLATHPSACPFRFSRLYDVTRHLRGAHSVELSQGEVRALYGEEELSGLPEPRGRGTKRGRMDEEEGEEEGEE